MGREIQIQTDNISLDPFNLKGRISKLEKHINTLEETKEIQEAEISDNYEDDLVEFENQEIDAPNLEAIKEVIEK